MGVGRLCVWASLWVRVWVCLGVGVCGRAGVWVRQCVCVCVFLKNF